MKTHLTLSTADRATLGPATRAALDAAQGDRAAAALALGISTRDIYRRIAECEPIDVANCATLREYVARRWPTRKGGPSNVTPVLAFAVEGYAPDRVYVYTLGCGTPDAPHVNRVPAVGPQRKAVVCQTCHPKAKPVRSWIIVVRRVVDYTYHAAGATPADARAAIGGRMANSAEQRNETIRSTRLAAGAAGG